MSGFHDFQERMRVILGAPDGSSRADLEILAERRMMAAGYVVTKDIMNDRRFRVRVKHRAHRFNQHTTSESGYPMIKAYEKWLHAHTALHALAGVRRIGVIRFNQINGEDVPEQYLRSDGQIEGTPDFVVGFKFHAGEEPNRVAPINAHQLLGIEDAYLVVDPKSGEKRTLLPRVMVIKAVQP